MDLDTKVSRRYYPKFETSLLMKGFFGQMITPSKKLFGIPSYRNSQCLRTGYTNLCPLLVWHALFKYEYKTGIHVHSTVQRNIIWNGLSSFDK
jgi:hypothetical protein